MCSLCSMIVKIDSSELEMALQYCGMVGPPRWIRHYVAGNQSMPLKFTPWTQRRKTFLVLQHLLELPYVPENYVDVLTVDIADMEKNYFTAILYPRALLNFMGVRSNLKRRLTKKFGVAMR